MATRGRSDAERPAARGTSELTAQKRHSFSYKDLLDCAHGRLFGPGNARLPLPPMPMFDRIVHISEEGGANGKGKVAAEFDIKPDLWFFQRSEEHTSELQSLMRTSSAVFCL